MGLRTKVFGRMGFRKRNPMIDLPGKIFHPMAAQQKILSDVKEPIVIDVGAYGGETALSYRAYFPDAEIYSFEPYPELYARMIEKVGDDPRIHPVRMAASDCDGGATFHTSDFPAANSLLPLHEEVEEWAHPSMLRNRRSMEVETIRLDTFCDREGIERVDCLKSDAQGYDLTVLQGAEGLLCRGRVGLVIVEVNITPHYHGQATMAEILSFLGGHGYRLFDLFGPCYTMKGQLQWCDLLFLGPDLAKRY